MNVEQIGTNSEILQKTKIKNVHKLENLGHSDLIAVCTYQWMGIPTIPKFQKDFLESLILNIITPFNGIPMQTALFSEQTI